MAMTQAQVRAAFIKANPGVRRIGMKGYWYRCAHCGKWCGRPGSDNVTIKDSDKMEVDHIQSWSHGGSDEIWNLQPLCKPCNRSKSNTPTLKDNIKIMGNTVMHPLDSAVGVGRKAARQNKVLKGLGITKRR
jgi:5-methylcytosine-specific restriction endonuclease McrA